MLFFHGKGVLSVPGEGVLNEKYFGTFGSLRKIKSYYEVVTTKLLELVGFSMKPRADD